MKWNHSQRTAHPIWTPRGALALSGILCKVIHKNKTGSRAILPQHPPIFRCGQIEEVELVEGVVRAVNVDTLQPTTGQTVGPIGVDTPETADLSLAKNQNRSLAKTSSLLIRLGL
jgi:hypothetical protein